MTIQSINEVDWFCECVKQLARSPKGTALSTQARLVLFHAASSAQSHLDAEREVWHAVKKALGE